MSNQKASLLAVEVPTHLLCRLYLDLREVERALSLPLESITVSEEAKKAAQDALNIVRDLIPFAELQALREKGEHEPN